MSIRSTNPETLNTELFNDTLQWSILYKATLPNFHPNSLVIFKEILPFFFSFVCMPVSMCMKVGEQLIVGFLSPPCEALVWKYLCIRRRGKCLYLLNHHFCPKLIPGPPVSPFLSTKRLMAKILPTSSSC